MAKWTWNRLSVSNSPWQTELCPPPPSRSRDVSWKYCHTCHQSGLWLVSLTCPASQCGHTHTGRARSPHSACGHSSRILITVHDQLTIKRYVSSWPEHWSPWLRRPYSREPQWSQKVGLEYEWGRNLCRDLSIFINFVWQLINVHKITNLILPLIQAPRQHQDKQTWQTRDTSCGQRT